MSDVNPQMVTLAREARELTQRELADLVGISQANISKIESSLLSISDDMLYRLSEKLDFPPSFFRRFDPLYGATTSTLYHRKRQSLSVKKLAAIHAWLNIHRLAIAALLRSVEIEPKREIPALDVDRYGAPEAVAHALRVAWAIPAGPVENVTQLIEDIGGVIVRYDLGTHLIDAVSHWVPGHPPMFLINASVPGDRLRFTLLHELAHLILHSIPHPEMEDEADAFASEFLMPARDIRPLLTYVTLAKLAALKPRWKVSMQALLVRAKQLETVSERQYRYLWMNMGKHGYRMAEPSEIAVPVEEPSLPRQLVDTHLRALGYSHGDLEHITALREREIRDNFFLAQARMRVVHSLP
jgi:Zn-dependent peptidase ImmA (M78 family)/plasmid maintenance system antidote protein VapI